MKKLHMVALSALMGGCMFNASAFTVDNVMYDVLDATAKTATVTGAITMSDGVLNIPETVVNDEDNETYTVTKINDSAFQKKTWIKKLVMGNNIETVGASAFWLCSNLQTVVYSTGLKNINAEAFKGCTALENAVLPEGLKTLASSAFNGCTSNKIIYVPGTVREIGNSAFYNNSSVTEVTVGEGCYDYETSCLAGLSSMKVLNLPKTFCNVNKSTFAGCNSLETINLAEGNPYYYLENGYLINKQYQMIVACLGTKTDLNDIPTAVQMLGWGCFMGMKNIQRVIIPKTVTDCQNQTFQDCTGLQNVTIGSGLNRICQSMFQGCTALKQVIMPITITTIGTTAFYKCSSLEDVEIPNAVETLQTSCFQQCSSLKDLILGMSVSSIQANAFKGCPLTTISVRAEEPPTVGNENAFDANVYTTAQLNVPEDCADAYKANAIWGKFTTAIPTGINENVADNEVSTIYYDLQGREVVNPQHGLYVKKQGIKTAKVIL